MGFPIFSAIGTAAGAFFGGPVGAGIGASLGSAFDNSESTSSTNAQNAQMAAENRHFQDVMSSQAHQREVKDLEAAGLNPILSAGGNGSSTPAGNVAQMQAPQIQLPDLMSYGISLKQLEQTDQKLAIEKANSAAGIARSLSEQDLNKMKKVLMQKGMIRAELEGEGSQLLRNIIKFLKNGSRRTPDLNKLADEPKFESGTQPSLKQNYNLP